MYLSLIVAALASGVILGLLMLRKKAMLLSTETVNALSAARAELVEHDNAAEAALAQLKSEIKALENEKRALANSLKTAQAQLSTLLVRFGLKSRTDYTQEEIEAAVKKARQTRQLGTTFVSMFNDARRRGII